MQSILKIAAIFQWKHSVVVERLGCFIVKSRVTVVFILFETDARKWLEQQIRYNTMNRLFTARFCVMFSLLLGGPVALAAQADEIFYQCYGRTQAGIGDASPLFCQCVNNRAAQVLNPADLAQAQENYNYLQTLAQRQSDPHSYERYAGLIFSDCQVCKKKNYRGCLPPGAQSAALGNTEIMLINMADAQFDLIERDAAYKDFVVDVINVVGDTCPAKVRNPIEIWVETLTDGEVTDTTDRLRLDRRIHARYKTYTKDRSRRASRQLAQEIDRSQRAGQLPFGGFDIAMTIVQQRREMFSLLGTDCSTNGLVDRVYRNVLSLELGDPVARPAETARRITAPVRDPARLERTAKTIKQASDAAYAQVVAKGPLRCTWQPEQVNGTQQPEANGLSSVYSMLEDYSGSYTVQLGDNHLDMGLWAMSKLPGSPEGSYGLYGVGQIRGTDCAVYVGFNATVRGPQAILNFGLVNDKDVRAACRATTAFARSRLNGFGKLGKPGESIPLYLQSIPWKQNATGVCVDEVVSLTPTKLSSKTVAFLKSVQELQWPRKPNQPFRGAPDSFWQSVTK